MNNEVAMRAKGICKGFDGKSVLEDLSVSVSHGELLAIIGPSGVGKTTLLRILNGLLEPDKGKVYFMKEPLGFEHDCDLEARRRMALLSQKPYPLMKNVWDNVAYPLRLRDQKEIDKKVSDALEHVSLLETADRKASTLSSGELQRMAFARATVFEPEILLLDEFTAHLDPYNISVLEDAVDWYLKEKNAAIVMVTHNLFQAERISSSTAFLFDGEIIERDRTEKIFNEPEDERTEAFVSGEMVF
ncbi:MAG: ATP-binding cassette domain-containing protein [Candidatus Thermoplasmatota archaeon]|nr:ATP-binding cassette domain-containing protein [Candidatus Thermoplasmatota archaeon]MBS3790350.1 ATP-binding cassette domain-containing protein [Candidatus Thermoplasmatota archaeon]